MTKRQCNERSAGMYTIEKIFNRTTSYWAVKDANGKFVTIPGTRKRVGFWTERMAAEYIANELGGTVGETNWSGTAR